MNANWDKLDEELNSNNIKDLDKETRIAGLETDNTTNKQNIDNLQEAEEVQNTKIKSLQETLDNTSLGLNIKGTFDTVEELERAYPVGVENTGYIINEDVYIWDTEKSQWIDAGTIKGKDGIGIPTGGIAGQVLAKKTNIDGDTEWKEIKGTNYIAGTGIEITSDNVINNTQTSANWGNISGTLENQTDLSKALKSKANVTDIPAIPENVSSFYNDAGYLTQHQDISNKVDKIEGKGLSTNDYTTTEKTKLSGISEGANKTTVVDNLTSTSAIEALSASQGKILNEKIENKSSLPKGGTTGQVLSKASDADNDVEWSDNEGIITGDTLPIGSIMPYGNEISPSNWLLCQGQEVSRIDYSELFAVISTNYGTGDGSTTFNLPNLKGRVPVGQDNNDMDFNVIGKIGGKKEHTHLSGVSAYDNKLTISNKNAVSSASLEQAFTVTGTTGFSSVGTVNAYKYRTESSSSTQPYVIFNYIIKVKQSAGLVATVVDNLNSESSADALSAKQGKVLNEKSEKNIITAYINQSYSTAGINKDLSLSGAISIGNKLSVVDGKIVIGSGVKKILISGKMLADNTANTTDFFYIRKNEAIISRNDVAGIYITSSVPPFLVAVEEGDTISIFCNTGTNATIYEATHITVEVVE